MGRKADIKRATASGKEILPTPQKGNQKSTTQQLRCCPVPEPISCLLGCVVGEDEEGRGMVCTNVSCHLKNVLIHDRCFDAYEDHLVKVLSNMGSARGWTEGQRRQNLWEKKGLSLVGKMCRCRCGAGLVVKDDHHDIMREQREREALEQQNGIKKKKCRKESNLPKLNPGGVKGNPLFPEPKGKKQRARVSSECESEESSSFTSEYLASRRESAHQTSFNECNAWTAKSHSVLSEPVDDAISVFSECEKEISIQKYEPAPPPAPLTRSFAAAIRKPPPVDTVSNEKEKKQPIDSPLTVQTDMNGSNAGMDSGIEMKSSTTSVSDGDQPGTPPNESSGLSPLVRQGQENTTVTNVSTPLSSKAAKRAAKEAAKKAAEEYASAARIKSITPRVGASQMNTTITVSENTVVEPTPISTDSSCTAPSMERVESDENQTARGSCSIQNHLLDMPPGLPIPTSLRFCPPGLTSSAPLPPAPLSSDLFSASLHSPSTPLLSSFSDHPKFTSTPLRNGILSSISSVRQMTAAEISFASAVTNPLPPPICTPIKPSDPPSFGFKKNKKGNGGVVKQVAPPVVTTVTSEKKEEVVERPTTPNSWEDELPPEWVCLDDLPLYHPFLSRSFLLGETVIAQKNIPGFW